MPGSTHSASQLLQSLALVYIRTDKAGVVQEWSAAATSATGIDPASAINRSAADILSPPSEVRAAIADAVAGKLTHGLEVCLGEKLRGDAAARVDSMRLLLQVAPDEDGGGGVMLVGQDISKVKGRDGAMNITKTRFMMDMSHEMRTPLNVITGMTDLILETHLEQEQRMFAEQIQASAEGLLVLINDIIDLTEIEAGTLELKAVDFDIRSALEDAIDTVAISGNSKGLEICGYIDPKLRTHVHGDVDRLRQILVYLMANGVKHNKMGGVYITVRLHEEHADRVAFQFESRDTGSGISPDHVAALFDMEKFTKVRRSQEGEHSVERFQSRLGLYMANYLCRLMQGEMTCTSTLGQGTTISFTAVFAKSRWSSDVAAAAGGARLMVPASLQGKKAIIVTDNAFLRETMEANVTAFGLQSAVAPSIAAAEALGPADVLIVSPAPSAISSLQRAEDPAGGEGGVGTDLEVHMKELASRPVQCPTILLCPISQLGHVVSLRKQCGAECTVASRPTRIGNLLSVLVHTLEAGMQNKWIPWMFHTSSASAVAGDKEADVDEDEDDGLIGASGAERPKGMRMLLALSAEVKDSVRSLFVKIGNACDLCLSANEVRVMVTDTDELLLYDSVVLDHQLLGKNTIQIIKDLHLYQRRQTVPKRLILIAIINKADTACEAALWGAGVDAVVCHPVDEINLQHALANAAANASIRLNQLLKLDMGGSGSASAIGTPVALREATAPPITPWSSEPADDGMKRVVVVDEDAIRQRVIKSYLTKDGFEVTLVKDAPAALEVLDSALCHLILLHVVPAGSGEAPAIGLVPELLRKAAGAGGRVPPIIGVLDAEASAEEEAEYAAAGIGGTLIKPIIKDSLLQMAHKLLERAECARSTALPVGMGAVGEASNKVLRILAADGDGGQRLMLKSMLSRDKHFVDVAENGADAVKLASKNHYDVILLDCYMPVTNGWEASREIRKREFERGLQVAAIIIGISVAKTSEDAENVRTSGLTNLLYRPITRESLRACIAASLTQPSTPSLPPPPTAAGFSRVQSHNVQLHNPAGSPSPSPVSTAPATPVSASPAAAQEKNVAPLVAGGGRVVICDPENGQRLILKKLLNKFGREVCPGVRGRVVYVCACVMMD
jgi:signal transduction histidine kinase/CheY-like chemotaxis protein